MARIISLANQKGGVGKTTTTISLGAAIAELGHRVLLVDFDPQGSMTVGMGVNANGLDLTIYNALLDRSVDAASIVTKTSTPNVELIPANIDLSAAEVVLVSEVAREQALRRCLAPLVDDYDFMLIDCPPSLGLLTINALTASHEVIIPLECEFFALRGMALLVDTIDKVRDRLNPQLELKGIVPTMFDGRTLHAREVLERVRQGFGDKLFKTVINRTIRFAEAPVAGEPILTYAPDSSGARAYRNLAKEVLGIDNDQTSDPAGGGRAVPGHVGSEPAAGAGDAPGLFDTQLDPSFQPNYADPGTGGGQPGGGPGAEPGDQPARADVVGGAGSGEASDGASTGSPVQPAFSPEAPDPQDGERADQARGEDNLLLQP